MSMFVHNVSAYQQLQNWRSSQTNVNNQQMGVPGSATDFSSAFTDAATNYYSSSGTLAANQALNRIQQKSASQTAKTSGATPTGDQKLAAAQAAGKAMLTSLGLDYSTMFPSTSGTSNTSSSGAYQAPTNASTGYGYVAVSASNLDAMASVNFLA